MSCTRVTQGKAFSHHHKLSNLCNPPAGFLQSFLGLERIMMKGWGVRSCSLSQLPSPRRAVLWLPGQSPYHIYMTEKPDTRLQLLAGTSLIVKETPWDLGSRGEGWCPESTRNVALFFPKDYPPRCRVRTCRGQADRQLQRLWQPVVKKSPPSSIVHLPFCCSFERDLAVNTLICSAWTLNKMFQWSG